LPCLDAQLELLKPYCLTNWQLAHLGGFYLVDSVAELCLGERCRAKDGVGGAVSKRRRVAGQLIGARLVGWEGLVFLR
jgi:hypothetical protein